MVASTPIPPQVFDPAPVRGRAQVPIWPWLAILALALFLTDVALRRLVLTAGDVDFWRQGMVSAKTKERKRVEARIGEAESSGTSCRDLVGVRDPATPDEAQATLIGR